MPERMGCSPLAPRLYAPELGRNDPSGHSGYGPIIAVVK